MFMLTVSLEPYAAIGITIALVTLVTVAMLILAHTIGPKRHGPVKDTPYESGMPPVSDTKRRFNVRFSVIAVLFLLFDVEVVFLWPWAQVFHAASAEDVTIPLEGGAEAGAGFLLAGMAIFFALLVFGLLYEWKRGAFRWD